MVKKYKGNLELNWINKDKSLYYEYDEEGDPGKPIWIDKNDIRVSEPRILKLVEEYGDVSELNNPLDNALIRGDNLLALKTLVELFKEREEKDKVKLIYIDPPYNTGSAFEHYDDNIENSEWLTMMKDRLILLRKLLRQDGYLVVQIDNRQSFYLKILLDEVFGRNNFINDIIWKRRGGSANPSNRLNNVTDYLFWYRNSELSDFKPIFSIDDENTQKYIKKRFTGVLKGKKYMLAPIERNAKLGLRETLRYEYKGYKPKWGWMVRKEKLIELDNNDRLHWNTNNRPNRRVFLEDYKGQPISNLWTDIFVINPMAKERTDFEGGQKPEALIGRFIEMCTSEGDLILDSFLGSGTTAAISHKMKRRWIGIEIGKHAETHCIKRLNLVIKEIKEEIKQTKLLDEPKNRLNGFRYYILGDSLVDDNKMNWELSYEEVAQALFMNFDYNYKEKISDNIFLGKSGWNLALCIVGKELKILKKKEIEELLSKITQSKNTKIAIFTNHGIAIKNDDLPDTISIKKIPESILKKYNL